MSEILDIHGLLGAINLDSVSFLEVSARKAEDDSDHVTIGVVGDIQVTPSFTLKMGRSQEGDKFLIRLRTDISTPLGAVAADAAAEYTLANLDAGDISDTLMLEFANRVGIMTLLPYLRQAVSDMSQRVFSTALTMPVYKNGDLSFNIDDPVAE